MQYPGNFVAKYVNVGDLVFVETGTYQGDSTALAVKLGFKRIHTIEINEGFYKQATQRFSANKNVCCHLGDTRAMLPSIIKDIDESGERCAFWFDAHPIVKVTDKLEKAFPLIDELKLLASMKRNDHVVCIDDMHVIRKSPGFGETFDDVRSDLRSIFETINPQYCLMFPDVGYNAKVQTNVCCVAIPNVE